MTSQVSSINPETLCIQHEEFIKNGLSGLSIMHQNLVNQIITTRGFAPGECIILKHINGVVIELAKTTAPKGAKHARLNENPTTRYAQIVDTQNHGKASTKKHYIKCADYKERGLGYVPFANKAQAISMANELDLDSNEYLVFTYRRNVALRATAGSKPKRKRKKKQVVAEIDHKEAQPRIFKVAYRYFDRANSKSQAFPQIRLQGKWLEEIGFHIGGFMGLTCEDGKIILTPINHHEE